MYGRSRIPGLRRLLRLPASLRRVEREVDDEVRFHLESRARDLIAQGMPPNDAWRAAHREYGDIASSRAELVAMAERVRARERRADFLDAARLDLGYAIRGIRRQPGFAAAVVCTLALAIGANGAVFSLIDPLLFRPPGRGRGSSSRAQTLYVSAYTLAGHPAGVLLLLLPRIFAHS